MPSPRTPSRVTIPCRSSRSSASARRSGWPAKSAPARAQRPCVAVGRWARERAKRRDRRSGPHEIPQRGERDRVLELRVREQVVPETGAVGERSADRVVLGALRSRRGGGLPEHGRVLAEEDGDAVEAGTDPNELAGCAQLVELFRAVAGDAARQHLRLPERDWQGQALQRDERLAQRRAAVDAVPARQEAAERSLLRRLDLAP